MDEGKAVRFRGCECPGTPHPDGDVVYLRSTLGWSAGAEALRVMGASIDETGGMEKLSELIGPVYLREGPLGWNVVDEDGPVDYDPDVILGNYTWAYPIVEAADDLYSTVVLAPLLARMSAQSGSTRNGPATSVTRRSSSKARSPRKSSSPNGSAGPQSVGTP